MKRKQTQITHFQSFCKSASEAADASAAADDTDHLNVSIDKVKKNVQILHFREDASVARSEQ